MKLFTVRAVRVTVRVREMKLFIYGTENEISQKNPSQ
jgi:hypothetical protein